MHQKYRKNFLLFKVKTDSLQTIEHIWPILQPFLLKLGRYYEIWSLSRMQAVITGLPLSYLAQKQVTWQQWHPILSLPHPSTPSRQHKVQLPNVVFANMYGKFAPVYLCSGGSVVEYRIVNPRYVCSSLLNFKIFFSSERQLMDCQM